MHKVINFWPKDFVFLPPTSLDQAIMEEPVQVWLIG